MQQFSPRHGSVVGKSPVQRCQGNAIFLGHGRQHPHHDPPFGHVHSVGVPARITQQPIQLSSEGCWPPTHADPWIIFKRPQQFCLHAGGISSQPLAQREPQPTVGVKGVHCEPLEKITPGHAKISILQCFPALLGRWRRRRWQRDVVHAGLAPMPSGRPPFHTVGAVPPGSPSQGVAPRATPAQKAPAKRMTGGGVVMPVPAATKPPMVVIHGGPAVESRTQMNVDVDDGAGFGFPPADRGGAFAVGLRQGTVLSGGTVQEPGSLVGRGRWREWSKGGIRFLHRSHIGCDRCRGRRWTFDGGIAFGSDQRGRLFLWLVSDVEGRGVRFHFGWIAFTDFSS